MPIHGVTLDGIDPANVAGADSPELTPVEDEPKVELHDSEIKESSKILAALQEKYGHRPASHENLKSMADEAIDRFAKIGLQVTVDWIRTGLTGEPPQINIVGRLTPFDPERWERDVKAGVADDFWERQRAKASAEAKARRRKKQK